MTCKLLELNTHCLQTRHAMVVHNLSDENTLLEFVFLNVQALYPTALENMVNIYKDYCQFKLNKNLFTRIKGVSLSNSTSPSHMYQGLQLLS